MTLLNIPTQAITNKTTNKPNFKPEGQFQPCPPRILLSLKFTKIQCPGQHLNKAKRYPEVGPWLSSLLSFQSIIINNNNLCCSLLWEQEYKDKLGCRGEWVQWNYKRALCYMIKTFVKNLRFCKANRFHYKNIYWRFTLDLCWKPNLVTSHPQNQWLIQWWYHKGKSRSHLSLL